MAHFEQGGGVFEPLASWAAAEMGLRHHHDDHDDDWHKNDYKAFIRSQRGSRLQQHARDDGGDDDEAAFAFTSSTGGGGGGGAIRTEHMETREQSSMQYFDMDATLPLHWESLINSCRHSSSSREFEFDMVVPEAEDGDDRVGISHADELFYKGQLLPLHLRPRLQMVEKLTSEEYELQQKAAADDDALDSSSSSSVFEPGTMVPGSEQPFGNMMSAASLSRFFQPAYVKFCVNSTDVAPTETALDSRSSSFRSQTTSSFWESAADNSSSRDSNGSSQDACFASCNEFDASSTVNAETLPMKSSSCLKESPFLHNREVFSTHDYKQPDKSSSTFSSWLRPPFKWKVLFGVKKVSKPRKEAEKSAQTKTPQRNQVSESSSSSSSSSYSACPSAVQNFNAPPSFSPNKHRSSRDQTWWSSESAPAAFVISTPSTTQDPTTVTATDARERRERSHNLFNNNNTCERAENTSHMHHDPYHQILPVKNHGANAGGASRMPPLEADILGSETHGVTESSKEISPQFCHAHSTGAVTETSDPEQSINAAGLERSKTSKDRWKKYIKMLKPPYGKSMPAHIFDLVKLDNHVRTAAATTTPPSSSSRRAGSLPFIKPTPEKKAAAAAAAPPLPPPPQKSFSGSLSFPSSSMSQTSRIAAMGGGSHGAPRRSNANDSCGPPGLLQRPVSQSTMSELQSSLQGAIAHCKQSHCALKQQQQQQQQQPLQVPPV